MPTDVNVLIRGQSNAVLFTAFGAAGSLEQQLEAKVAGVDIHILAEYDTDTSTMYSATGFLDWPRDGEQQGLLTFLRNEPADIRDNPTITLWMHNEHDGNTPGVTTDQWVAAVRADAALVRGVLGQGAATTPYTFTYVDYPFTASGSPQAIQAGMNLLSADPGFNASFASTALQGLAMDGPGYPPAGHIGYGDAYTAAGRLADFMAGTVATLAGSGTGGGSTGGGGTGGGSTGGGGTVWDFNAVADSPKYAPRTLDWQAGDRINLSDVALSGAGNPGVLHWAGIDPEGPVKAWGVWGWGDGSGTLRVDVDGDSSADMSIILRGAPVLTGTEFILGTGGVVTPPPQPPAGRIFDFNAVADSPKYAPRTLDWQAGDRIDLSDVPLIGSGRPASLHWAGIDPEGPVKAWGVWGWGDGSGTLRVDVDGDSSADMSIILRGAPVLVAGDFILA